MSLTPMQRGAVLRLMAAAGRATLHGDRSDRVAVADARTSASDARAALSIAMGKPLDSIDPRNGTSP